jgi:hypothetical protein
MKACLIATLRLRLPAKALAAVRRALARRRPLSAKVTVSASDDVGNVTAQSRRIALRR